MIKTNRWVFYFTAILFIFMLFHTLVWFFYTSKIFGVYPKHVGDLGRMSYQLGSIHLREKVDVQLEKKHISAGDYVMGEEIDVLTIGDSFLNAGGAGLNPFIQDYIASLGDLKVMNIQTLSSNLGELDTINILYNSGLLDIIKPKHIIVESVQRLVSPRYARNHNFDRNMDLDYIKQELFTNAKWKMFLEVPEVSFINTGNYKYIYYSFLYMFNDNAQKNVYKLKLNKPMFSVNNNSTLLVYADDIKSSNKVTKEDVIAINDNFNKMSNKLAQKDIHLHFMIAVNKYDLYYDYIVNRDSLSVGLLLDSLQELEKSYNFINTKQILLPKLEANDLDIYYADDTHWSYKSSEAIASYIIPYLK